MISNKDNATYIEKINKQGFASALLSLGTNPGNGNTITLNGIVFTYKDAPTLQYDVQRGVDAATSITNLINHADIPSVATYLQGANINFGTYAETVLFIEYATSGAAGDTYTISSDYVGGLPATLTGGADGNWTEANETSFEYTPREITLETGTTNALIKTLNTEVIEGTKTLLTEADNTVTEHIVGPLTLEPGSTFISVAETGTSGQIIIPQDGVIDVAIAGGGGAGAGDPTNTSMGGGGGSALSVTTGILVSKGDVINFIIGAGGIGSTGPGGNGGTSSFNINGGTDTVSLGGNGGSGTSGGAGANGGGSGGGALNSGSAGVGFQFATLSVAIAGIPGIYVAGTGGAGGQYGAGGAGTGGSGNASNGGAGAFGGGGGGMYGGGGRIGGAGGAGYIYIAYKQDISTFPISTTTTPTKAFFDDKVTSYLTMESSAERCITKPNTYLTINAATLANGTNIVTDEEILTGERLVIDGESALIGTVTGNGPYTADIPNHTAVLAAGVKPTRAYLPGFEELTKTSSTLSSFVGVHGIDKYSGKVGMISIGDKVQIDDAAEVDITSVSIGSAIPTYYSDDGTSGKLGYYDEVLTGSGNFSTLDENVKELIVLIVGNGQNGGAGGSVGGTGGSSFYRQVTIPYTTGEIISYSVGNFGGNIADIEVLGGTGGGSAQPGGAGQSLPVTVFGPVGSGGAGGGHCFSCNSGGASGATGGGGAGGMPSPTGDSGAGGAGGSNFGTPTAGGAGVVYGAGGGGGSNGMPGGAGQPGATFIKFGYNQVNYTLGFAEQSSAPATCKALNRCKELAVTGKTFDGTKFTYTYEDYTKSGMAMQRMIVAAKAGTEILEPLTTKMGMV